MTSIWAKALTIAFAGFAAASRGHGSGNSCRLEASNTGDSVGEFETVKDVNIYHTGWRRSHRYKDDDNSEVILIVTDFYGVQSINNLLLADSMARAGYKVIVPDLFEGDGVPMNMPEGAPAFDVAAWRIRHPIEDIDRIIGLTIDYIRNDLGVKRIGGAGYCLGGKHVPRWMAAGKGIDVGFIAHPSNLTNPEIDAIAGPISIAAGQFDTQFTEPLRRAAVNLLEGKNATFQANLYGGAFHGFAVRPNLTIPLQAYAKQASFTQVIGWMDTWL